MEPINKKKPQPGHTELINVERLRSMIIGNWYYFLISIVLALAAAYFYIQYTLPTYRVTTTILIEEEDNAGFGQDNLLQGIGLRPGSQNLDNQIVSPSNRNWMTSFMTISSPCGCLTTMEAWHTLSYLLP